MEVAAVPSPLATVKKCDGHLATLTLAAEASLLVCDLDQGLWYSVVEGKTELFRVVGTPDVLESYSKLKIGDLILAAGKESVYIVFVETAGVPPLADALAAVPAFQDSMRLEGPQTTGALVVTLPKSTALELGSSRPNDGTEWNDFLAGLQRVAEDGDLVGLTVTDNFSPA